MAHRLILRGRKFRTRLVQTTCKETTSIKNIICIEKFTLELCLAHSICLLTYLWCHIFKVAHFNQTIMQMRPQKVEKAKNRGQIKVQIHDIYNKKGLEWPKMTK